jgi:1,4-alpha-glucan branching enzyme
VIAERSAHRHYDHHAPARNRLLKRRPCTGGTAVIYQVYPRSFQDANGEGSGDLAGVVARLPYLAELGVDAVWVSPIFASPMADFGYDISDYTAIDPLFGSMADFDALVASAQLLAHPRRRRFPR